MKTLAPRNLVSAWFETDYRCGLVSAPLRVTTIEDVAGWVVCTEFSTGKTLAYPPMHYSLATGLVALEV